MVLHKIETSDTFVLFCGPELVLLQGREASSALGDTQATEVVHFYDRCGASPSRAVVVLLNGSSVNAKASVLPAGPCAFLRDNTPRHVHVQSPMVSVGQRSGCNHSLMCPSDEEAEACAKRILDCLGHTHWIEDDGLPIGYPFDYEKDIIDEFANNGFLLSSKRL